MLPDQSYKKYRKTMKVNLDAPFLCSKYSLPLLEKSKSGRIVMISSIQGVRGYKGNISYNTAKGGLINMTRVLAVELADTCKFSRSWLYKHTYVCNEGW